MLGKLQEALKTHSHGHKAKLEEVLRSKRESDVRVVQHNSRIAQLESENAKLEGECKIKDT